MRFIGKLIKVFLLTGLLLIGVLIGASFLIPKDYYIRQVTRYVETHYPITLTLRDASLSLLPFPRVTVFDAMIRWQNEESQGAPITAKELSIGVNWISFLELIQRSSKPLAMDVDFDGKMAAFDGEPLKFSGTYEYDSENHLLSITRMRFEAGSLKTNLSGTIHTDPSQGAISLEATDLSWNVTNVFRLSGEKVKLSTNFTKTENAVSFQKGSFSIGPQQLAFSGTIADDRSTLTLNADPLKIDYLKRIMPSFSNLVPIEGARLVADIVKTGDLFSAAGHMNAAKIQTTAALLSRFESDFRYQNGSLRFSDIKASTMDGELTGSVQTDLSDSQPMYRLNLFMKNIAVDQIPSLSGALAGRGNLSLVGTVRNFDQVEWSKGLDGSGDVQLQNIQLSGLRLFEQLIASPLWSTLEGFLEKIPGSFSRTGLHELEQLDKSLSQLASAFTIVKGVIQIPKIEIDLSQTLLKLSGGIGLDKSIDFKGTVALHKNLISQVITEQKLVDFLTQKTGSLTLPIKIAGSVSTPIVTFDESSLKRSVEEFVKKQLSEKAEGIVQDILKNPPADIDDLLKNPF